MLTVAGSRMPMMVNPPGFNAANVGPPPKLTPEEEARRKALLQAVRNHDPKTLKKCETDDRSAPIAEGKRSVPGGWVDCGHGKAPQLPIMGMPKAPMPGKGPKGKGGLGDLFAGGFKPNPGALKPGGGRPMK